MPKKGPELVDQTAKLIAELDIEGLLELMWIDPGAEILESEPVQRELTLPQIAHGPCVAADAARGRGKGDPRDRVPGALG